MKTREELDKEKATLKTKYKDVYEVDVLLDDSEENTATIFLKTVDRMTYNQVIKFIGGNDSFKPIEIFVKALHIGGEPLQTILTNDYAIRSLDGVVAEMLYVKQSVLKKN